jgi:glutamyl-tRNA reductase
VIEQLELRVSGVNHRTAEVAVRERLAVPPAELEALLRSHGAAGRSALLLCTCNRTELYWAGPHDLHQWFVDFAVARGVDDPSILVRHDGETAIRHLFQVAAGLDSQILGETEILGQVRRAFDLARAAGTTTPAMDAVFSAALAVGRRVRRETLLGRHPVSVSSAAVEVAAERLGDGVIAGGDIVVLGAGEVAEGVLRALRSRQARRVTLVNRHPERANVLAEAWGAAAAAWTELPERLSTADVLFVATAAKHPIVSAEQLRRALDGRGGRQLVVVDLAVPRNVEPAASELRGVALWDLDDLQRLRCPAVGAADPALADAQRLLDEELVRLEAQLRSRAAAPRLAELHRFGSELAAQEAAWALDQLRDLSDAERQIVRAMADRLVRRVLYPVSRAVREEDL